MWLIGGQLGLVVLWIVSAGVTTPAFAGPVTDDRGLVLLALALRDGFDAGARLAPLRSALGADFMTQTPGREAYKRLEQQIHSREWLWPFRFRRPVCAYVRNVAYSTAGKRGLLDVYLPVAQGQRRPVLLQVHGGAWMMGHKSEQAQPLLHRMVEMGWVGVSINYRSAPRDAYPAQIIDVKKAIAWVKQHIEEYGEILTSSLSRGVRRWAPLFACRPDTRAQRLAGGLWRASIRQSRESWRCTRSLT